jgi:hypothetical protein
MRTLWQRARTRLGVALNAFLAHRDGVNSLSKPCIDHFSAEQNMQTHKLLEEEESTLKAAQNPSSAGV